MMKRKLKGTFLQNLQKPLAPHQTRICSLKLVCGGVPQPDNREHFYPGQSACIICKAQQSKDRWAEKKKNRDTFYGY